LRPRDPWLERGESQMLRGPPFEDDDVDDDAWTSMMAADANAASDGDRGVKGEPFAPFAPASPAGPGE
jgi:hypothetical protein